MRRLMAACLVAGIFLQSAVPTYAIFRGFQGVSVSADEWDAVKVTRVIVKFADGTTPDQVMVNEVNAKLGVISMRPLFTLDSVGASTVGVGPMQRQAVKRNWFMELFSTVVRAQYGQPVTKNPYDSCDRVYPNCPGGYSCRDNSGDGDGDFCIPSSCPDGYPCGGGRPECEANCRYTCAGNQCATTMLRPNAQPGRIVVNDATCGILNCGAPTPTVTPLPTPTLQPIVPPPPPAPPPIVGSSPFISDEIQNFYVLEMDPDKAPAFRDVVALYSTIPNLESIEPDIVLKGLQAPNDAYYDQQWNLRKIRVDKIWDQIDAIVNPLTISVVDSGIATSHEDFSGVSFRGGRDYATCDEFGPGGSCQLPKTCASTAQGYCDSQTEDDGGHGTFMAGIISASIGNQKGIAGIAKKVTIIPVKVLNSNEETFETWTLEGVVYAVNQGARVINMSLGGCATPVDADGKCRHKNNFASKGFVKVFNYATRRNVTLIVAAGNNNDEVQWYTPANYNTTAGKKGRIAVVGATGPNDERAFYSNYGSGVTVSAPGGNVTAANDRNNDGSIDTDDCKTEDCILSLAALPGSERFSNPRYDTAMGTSMAAAHVTAVAALILSKNPGFTYTDVLDILTNSSDYILTDKPIGGKRINAAAAISFDLPGMYSAETAGCDRCGWCDQLHTQPPENWETCSACLYKPDGSNKDGSFYTMFGCFQSEPGKMAGLLVKNITTAIFPITGGISFLVFLYGALLLLTSAGEMERLQRGKHYLTVAIVGLLVTLFSVFILRFIGYDVLQIPGFG